jgi:hypothetical protein
MAEFQDNSPEATTDPGAVPIGPWFTGPTEADIERMKKQRDRASRRRCYVMPEERLLLCIQGRYILERLPADAEIAGVHQDKWGRGFLIHVVSREFDPVPDGMESPVFSAGYRTVDAVKLPSGKCCYVADNQTVEETPQGVRFREFL